MPPVKYWEIVARKLSAAGWTWGYCSAAPEGGRWIVAAHKNGQRHIVHSDELLSPFLELEANAAVIWRVLEALFCLFFGPAFSQMNFPCNSRPDLAQYIDTGADCPSKSQDTKEKKITMKTLIFAGQFTRDFRIALLTLVCVALPAVAQAQLVVCPSGCDLSSRNTYFGSNAISDLGANNTGIGASTLEKNTGSQNTAVGDFALNFNTTGVDNTAIGFSALGGGYPNGATGSDDTATGADALASNTTGSFNTANGFQALFSNTTGGHNTATGSDALKLNTTGNFNTATGDSALLSNTTGINNTANGFQTLMKNTSGGDNTGLGSTALAHNTTGGGNTAMGFAALLTNTTGANNTATGLDALVANTIGNANTATGSSALESNTSGSSNTATGLSALQSNATGSFNTATGLQTLLSNTTGAANTATGSQALSGNTTGGNNTATGFTALQSNNGNDNTADGFEALFSNTTGSDNTAVGLGALINNTSGKTNVAVGSNAGQNLTTGSNNIDVGANVVGNASDANTIRIGKQGTQKATFIAGIFGTAVTGSPVVVASNGKLGVATSSARFKEAIKPMDKNSEAILALKPVTFHYKEELDPDKAPQFGLVAEEVQKVDPELVIHDDQGKPFTVRYEAVNAMLLNEFLKEHRRIEQLQAENRDRDLKAEKQEAMIAKQQSELNAMRADILKVSHQIEANE
jgi:hypothetical protein